MGLEQCFEKEEHVKIDWKLFEEKIKDYNSNEYKIFHSNISSNKLNATKI